MQGFSVVAAATAVVVVAKWLRGRELKGLYSAAGAMAREGGGVGTGAGRTAEGGQGSENTHTQAALKPSRSPLW